MKLLKKNKILVFFLIIISIVILVLSNKNEGFVDDKEYDIVIIAGQSNAQGNGEGYFIPNYDGMQRGTIDEPLYNDPFFQKDKGNKMRPSDDPIRNKIKMFTSDNTIVRAQDAIDHFKETKIKRTNPYGFGIPFARQYVKEKNKEVILLGCAMGSTAFKYYGPANGATYDTDTNNYGWGEGDSSPNVCNGKNCSLFKMSKERIKAAKAEAPRSRVVAILWHQGENDAERNPREYYAAGVSQMLKKLRSYAIEQFPNSPANFPIMVGGLCTYYQGYIPTDKEGKLKDNYRNTMNHILKSMENASDNIRFVPSDDSLGSSERKFNHLLRPNSRSSDGGKVHFSIMAQIEFGYRYYYIFNDKKPIDFSKF